ncbi:hypothetical protein MGG_15529 [Pyricularia oryzae 70-15]|uniref:Uncharacterized protein n=1 Tax=Pyricularia oryzae (strain 70-15 / ATCC MYA-4617 / FGSC 8958) TaxID=242507 RepID=G4MZ00_PYRO7|nr:uncharacterized protein MGG_15529 [Pyricularia oryzae 70-15]EHA53661.1 hypothetical protein MGG_15529 [Pyricularia oryzae 70-15]
MLGLSTVIRPIRRTPRPGIVKIPGPDRDAPASGAPDAPCATPSLRSAARRSSLCTR